MASTYSDLKFELIGTGEQSGTWGVTTNTNIGTAIQEAITGSADVTFASGNVTLTLTNTNATQTARNLRLNCTGTTGGARDLIVPSIEKFYLVNNGCADAITVKNSTGTGIAVPASKAMLVFNNGTNVVDAITHLSSLTLATALAIAQGGTGATTDSGARTNLGLGTIATQAANNVSITGGSITGITDLAVADGGTGASSFTANNVLLGNGTSAFQTVAPGTSGNVLTSNGTTWASTPVGGGFASGTLMLFQQTAAPTGWTKDTTHNNKALRVVTGTASSGGSVAFTTAFASQTPTGSVSITSVTGSAGATTLTTPQIPSHSHNAGNAANVATAKPGTGAQVRNINTSAPATSSTGGGGSHTHPFSFSSGSGTFSGNAINLAVQYVDLIIASKD
jgi:hypothetical protein